MQKAWGAHVSKLAMSPGKKKLGMEARSFVGIGEKGVFLWMTNDYVISCAG